MIDNGLIFPPISGEGSRFRLHAAGIGMASVVRVVLVVIVIIVSISDGVAAEADIIESDHRQLISETETVIF